MAGADQYFVPESGWNIHVNHGSSRCFKDRAVSLFSNGVMLGSVGFGGCVLDASFREERGETVIYKFSPIVQMEVFQRISESVCVKLDEID